MTDPVKALQKQVEDLQKAVEDGQVTRVIQTQQKLKSFDGTTGDVGDWVLEVERAIRIQGLTGRTAVDLIETHLEGAAKEEVKYADKDKKKDPASVFKILREAFGEKLSTTQLLDAFYARRQREKETLREFSHGLMSLLARVRRKDPQAITDGSQTRLSGIVSQRKFEIHT